MNDEPRAMNDDFGAKGLLAAAIDVPRDAVPDDARIGAQKGWDSLAHIRLMLAIEERLRRELDAAEAAGIESVQDIERVLRSPNQS